MIAALLIAWAVVAVAGALLLGRAIHLADVREVGPEPATDSRLRAA